MRKLALALLAAVPALALAQEPSPADPDAWQQEPAQYAAPPQPAQPPPQAAPPAPQAVPPPPQAAPPAPQAVPPQYAPPAPQYAPPPPPPPAYAPPPQPPPYAPPARPPPPPAVPAPPEKQRGSWYIGFGLGTGDGNVELSDGRSASFSDMVGGGGDRFAFNFRVGGTLTPRLLLGFDGGFVSADGSDDASLQVNTYDVGVMFFPQERGLYLRAAVGRTVIQQTIPGFGDAEAAGLNVIGGVGYAFWLGRTFNLTLNVDAQRHWVDDPGVDGATAWSGWLGFDWY